MHYAHNKSISNCNIKYKFTWDHGPSMLVTDLVSGLQSLLGDCTVVKFGDWTSAARQMPELIDLTTPEALVQLA